MLSTFFSGLSAGILISIGGSVFLSCENRYVGAVLFSVALICICLKGYALFTGRVGFIPEKHDRKAVSDLFVCLLGNFVATVICGLMLRYAIPSMRETAHALCESKLTQAPPATFVRSLFCGVIMYLAVSIFRDSKNPLGILYGIPVFILSGFEHSIADMYYFSVGGTYSLSAVWFLLIVLAGNAAVSMLLPLLKRGGSHQ